jgi:uncharacterized membrane protein HdeD (DUF308 family)
MTHPQFRNLDLRRFSMFKSTSTSLLWRGILAIAIGLVSVAWPGITVGAFVIMFAVYAFMVAAADAARAFSSRGAGPVVGYLLLSVLSATAGVVAIARPGITALFLTLWVGAWAFVTGTIEATLAFRRGEAAGERAMWMLGGLISIAFGVVLAIRPDAGAVSLATVFGLYSIVTGISSLVLSAQLRRADTTAERLISSAFHEPASSR